MKIGEEEEAGEKDFWEFVSRFKYDEKEAKKNGWDNYIRKQRGIVTKQFSYVIKNTFFISLILNFLLIKRQSQMKALENRLGKYTWVLMKKLDKLFPSLSSSSPVKSYSFLGLLAHIIISKGLFFFLI